MKLKTGMLKAVLGRLLFEKEKEAYNIQKFRIFSNIKIRIF